MKDSRGAGAGLLVKLTNQSRNPQALLMATVPIEIGAWTESNMLKPVHPRLASLL